MNELSILQPLARNAARAALGEPRDFHCVVGTPKVLGNSSYRFCINARASGKFEDLTVEMNVPTANRDLVQVHTYSLSGVIDHYAHWSRDGFGGWGIKERLPSAMFERVAIELPKPVAIKRAEPDSNAKAKNAEPNSAKLKNAKPKADRILDRLYILIPRCHREDILGDLREDVKALREEGYSEKIICQYVRWQLFCTVLERLKPWRWAAFAWIVHKFIR